MVQKEVRQVQPVSNTNMDEEGDVEARSEPEKVKALHLTIRFSGFMYFFTQR